MLVSRRGITRSLAVVALLMMASYPSLAAVGARAVEEVPEVRDEQGKVVKPGEEIDAKVRESVRPGGKETAMTSVADRSRFAKLEDTFKDSALVNHNKVWQVFDAKHADLYEYLLDAGKNPTDSRYKVILDMMNDGRLKPENENDRRGILVTAKLMRFSNDAPSSAKSYVDRIVDLREEGKKSPEHKDTLTTYLQIDDLMADYLRDGRAKTKDEAMKLAITNIRHRLRTNTLDFVDYDSQKPEEKAKIDDAMDKLKKGNCII